MTASRPEDDEATSRWIDLVRDGRATHTLLISLGVAVHAIDIFVIVTIMPAVVADIGGVAFYTWTALLYVVASILGSASGDIARANFGRRRAFVLAGAVFTVGTAACAAAPSMTALLIFRLIQGYGGGLVLAQSMALIGEFYADRLRPRIVAVQNAVWTAAALLGPTIGGVFAEIGWWRGAFWSMVPLMLGFMVVAWRKILDSKRVRSGPAWPLGRLALLAAGVMGLAISGQVEALASRTAYIGAGSALVYLAFRLDSRAKSRLFPTTAIDLRTTTGTAYWILILISITYTAITIFMPLVLQLAHGISLLWIGYYNGIFSVAWSAGSFAAAGLRGERERDALIGGMIVAAGGIALLAIGGATAPLWLMAIAMLVLGLGIGATNVIVFTWAMKYAAKGEESITAAGLPTMRSLGVAFGSAAAGFVANSAGLDEQAINTSIENVVYWVYGLDVLPPLFAAAFATWLAALVRRRRALEIVP